MVVKRLKDENTAKPIIASFGYTLSREVVGEWCWHVPSSWFYRGASCPYVFVSFLFSSPLSFPGLNCYFSPRFHLKWIRFPTKKTSTSPKGGQSWRPTKRFVSISIEIHRAPPYVMRILVASWENILQLLSLSVSSFIVLPSSSSFDSFSTSPQTGNIRTKRFIDSNGICESFTTQSLSSFFYPIMQG